MKDPIVPLEQAEEHVQLAVELIYLLEINQIAPDVALKAVKLVEQDLLHKVNHQAETSA